jgi:hypothetical protein
MRQVSMLNLLLNERCNEREATCRVSGHDLDRGKNIDTYLDAEKIFDDLESLQETI